MSSRNLFSVVFFILVITASLTKAITPTNTESLELSLFIPTVEVATGIEQGYLEITLDNFNYEIYGFQFVLVLSRPDLVTFNFSGLGFDTIGTLTSGFEYIEAIDKNGDQSAYWFRCIADLSWIPGTRDGILPQQGGVAIRVPFSTTPAPDTTQPLLSEISIGLPTDFSDPFAYSIGAVPDTVVDTTYANCLSWSGDSCVSWVEVTDTTLGYEIVIFDSTVVGRLDPEIVQIIEGTIFIDILNCDLDGSGEITISDLICLVNYMFYSSTTTPCPLLYCDTDSSNDITISDLVYLVAYMFNSGPPPPEL